MGKPLELFIKPPYTDWRQIHGYGPDPVVSNRVHSYLLLEKTGQWPFVAAATGFLSARPPKGGISPSNLPVTIPSDTDPLPFSVTLYLHVSLMTPALNLAYRDRARSIHDINAFVYFNVETTSLEAGLAELLDNATAPKSVSLPRNAVVAGLVRGEINVPVTVGHRIGNAAVSINASADSVRLGFTVLTNVGPLDPSFIYDHMRDFVEDGQPDLDEFLLLAPKGWPVIAPTTTTPAAILQTETVLYPWAVLIDMKNTRNLSYAEWRTVGNNQKRLWRERLLRRTPHAPPGSTAPPFEFDDQDWRNPFQMEAIVEFYINYVDPWNPNTAPLDPLITGKIVDFVDPAGSMAMAMGNTVMLDGEPDLSRVRTYQDYRFKPHLRDYIFLAADTARPSKLYKITRVDNVGKAVTLDQTPTLVGASSPWEIRLRPHVIVIDSFGGRLTGDKATATGSMLKLAGKPDLSKINKDFDTIYLPSDMARESRAYRIIDVNDHITAKTVTVDGLPVLSGGTANDSSAWHIPSGISGELPEILYSVGPGGTKGYDHFDGVLFVVANGQILTQIRWSSYTSRKFSAGSIELSSLRGNKSFDLMSYKSGEASRNYSFRVTDHGALSDSVSEARFYFSTPVQDDSDGKTVIRLHYSRKGDSKHPIHNIDSAGCVVSPNYYDLRRKLIELYQQEYAALSFAGNTLDPEVQKAATLTNHEDSKKLYNSNGLSGAHWNNKIVATFWLIRPDERPN